MTKLNRDKMVARLEKQLGIRRWPECGKYPEGKQRHNDEREFMCNDCVTAEEMDWWARNS